MYKCDESIIQEMSEVTGMNYSDEQLDILRHRGGMCILACAGSGKTTILTHLLAKRIKTGEIKDTKKLLCTTFSKSGSSEMEERLDKLLKQLGINQRVQVKTLHASYYMVLKHFGIIGNVCSNSQRLRFVTQSAKEAGVNLSDEDLQTLDSLLSYQVNNLLSDDGLIKSYVYTLEDIDLEQYSAIRYGYNRKKEEAGLIDFDDLQLYMYMLLVINKRKDILDFCRGLWTDFFIDEFQDTSRIQFEITRQLVTDPNKLIVIGDDDQCIYQWRGADPNIILDICGYYDIQRFLLSTNYRCGGEIVKRAAVGIKNNVRRSEKEMIPYNTGGTIKICDTGNGDLYDISKYAYEHIVKLVKKEGSNPSEIAVLSRNNQHVSILNNMLFKAGVYCTTVPEMRMTNIPMYKDIKNVIKVAQYTYNINIVSSTLWKLCNYLGIKGSNAVASFMDATGVNILDALGYIVKNYTSMGTEIEWRGNINVPRKGDSKARYYFENIRQTKLYLSKYK